MRAARASGVIINSCGWVQDEGLQLLLHAARSLAVDMILVLDNSDQLVDDLREGLRDMTPRQMTIPVEALPGDRLRNPVITKLPISGGIVKRDARRRAATREARLRAYFRGRHGQLTPTDRVLPIASVQLVVLQGGGVREGSMRDRAVVFASGFDFASCRSFLFADFGAAATRGSRVCPAAGAGGATGSG